MALGLLLLPALVLGEVPVQNIEVVAEYPHDPEAFTQGLLIDDGELIESTGRYGESSLRRLDLQSGEIRQRHNLDERYFAEGIAVLDERLYQLTWRANRVFVYERDSFQRVDSYHLDGEGWGLTENGSELIVSDGSATLRFMEPETGRILRRVEVNHEDQPLNNLNELEFIRGEVWANIWYQDFIARIDPDTGTVKALLDLRGLYPEGRERSQEAVLNGIAWDEAEERLFVTGKLWPRLYEIRPQEPNGE